jgi:hypothetical protein
MLSADTEGTYVPLSSTITTAAYIENGISSNSGSSQVSLLDGNSKNGSETSFNMNYNGFFDDEYLSEIRGVIEMFGNTRLIFQGEAGTVSLKD